MNARHQLVPSQQEVFLQVASDTLEHRSGHLPLHLTPYPTYHHLLYACQAKVEH
jgi:hypothetical protein